MRELASDVEERNFAKEGLTKREIGAIVDAVGDMATLLNSRHAIAKANGWKDKPPSKTAFVKAAFEQNNLLRRPILIRGSEAVVGFDQAAIRALLA